MYSVKQASDLLGLCQSSVYQLCAEKKIRHRRVGANRGRIRIPIDAIEEYLAAGTVMIGAATPAAIPPKDGAPVKTLDGEKILAAWKAQGVG